MANAVPTPEDERLTAAVRVNLSPTELSQLQEIADEEDRPVAGVVRRAVREVITRREQRAGVTTHTTHPLIHERGLADGCPRCDQHAVDPFASLDEEVLRALAVRLREGQPARSDNEARAMAVLQRAMRESQFVERLVAT